MSIEPDPIDKAIAVFVYILIAICIILIGYVLIRFS